MRTGEGPKDSDSGRDIIADLSKKYNLTSFEEEFLHVFLALSPSQQKTVMDFATFLYAQGDKDLSTNDLLNRYRSQSYNSEITEETHAEALSKKDTHKTAV